MLGLLRLLIETEPGKKVIPNIQPECGIFMAVNDVVSTLFNLVYLFSCL